MYLVLVFLPLRGSLLAGLGGRWIGGAGATRITTAAVATSFFLSTLVFTEVVFAQSPTLIRLGPWRERERTTLAWSFLFDSLTCVRLLVVTSISTLVHLYSSEYRSEDPHLPRFRSYLSLFTFFRLILVTAESFVQRFVGWEGVGLASYLLINFWFARLQANKAAIKARVLNRVGDRGLSLAIFTIYWVFSSFDYSIVFARAPARVDVTVPVGPFSIKALDLIGALLTVGAVGKSAQVGLHTWLPDAREGPTPVSALIHAATRVTAGVFLICRCSPLLEYAPHISSLLTILGGRTAFLAATTGLLQNDLKRVIAYSTCSQLGYRVFAAGLSGYAVSVFHLANHAVFKALLFLGAGSVIHARGDEQDRRKRGGLVKILPLTYSTRRVGSLALRGFPFLAGFYSKDVILELAYASFTVEGRFVHTLGTIAAFFTAFYSRRLVALTFLGSAGNEAKGPRVLYEHAHEGGWPRRFPLLLLSVGSLVVGYLGRDRRLGLGSDRWGNALFTRPTQYYRLEGEWLDTSVKIVPLRASFAGRSLAVLQYTQRPEVLFALKTTTLGRGLYTFLNRKWRWDKVYAEYVAAPLLRVAYVHTYQNRDRGLLEWRGPQGLATELYSLSSRRSSLPLGILFRLLVVSRGSVVLGLGAVRLWPTILPLLDRGAMVVVLISVILLRSA